MNDSIKPLWSDNRIHNRIANHVAGELLDHFTSTEMLARDDVREMMFEMRDQYEALIAELKNERRLLNQAIWHLEEQLAAIDDSDDEDD